MRTRTGQSTVTEYEWTTKFRSIGRLHEEAEEPALGPPSRHAGQVGEGRRARAITYTCPEVRRTQPPSTAIGQLQSAQAMDQSRW